MIRELTKNRFDTKVQYLKYQVLENVARLEWKGELLENILDIPNSIIPGRVPTMRCCVYKERAILAERVKKAMGGDKNRHNVIQVIDIACDDCPAGGYEITNACRGCLAHRCMEACKKDAIALDHMQKAHIDKNKCIDCGLCSKACPYSAIIFSARPCQNACKVKAIIMSEEKYAQIDDEKCISCGACVYQCPFGAITDISYICDIINIIKKSENNTRYNTYAIVAPALASQFTDVKFGQVITGINKLGFKYVFEAALGADMVANKESKELMEKGFLTSSCCPAFVNFIEKSFPNLKDNISSNLSPMATISKYIKEKDPDCKIVFIGPCTAKKQEIKKEEVKDYVDSAMTFEELQALLDSKDIKLEEQEEAEIKDASYFGRIFARSGGLSEAVKQGLIENKAPAYFVFNPISCNGIEECKVALLKAQKGLLPNNFIEGMACIDGCIGGSGVLTHGMKRKIDVDTYGQNAGNKTILSSIEKLESLDIGKPNKLS